MTGFENESGSGYEFCEVDLGDEQILNKVVELKRILQQGDDGVFIPFVDNPVIDLGTFEGDNLIGFIETDANGSINVAVHPGHQGKGIATSLLSQTTQVAKDRGMSSLSAVVFEGSASERLFQKAGFELANKIESASEQTKCRYVKSI